MGQRKDSDSNGDSSGDGEKHANKVSFGKVRIHTHDVTLSSNPAVSSGLPMELQWDHIESENFSIEDYEEMGGGTKKKPLRVSKVEREKRLVANGHSRSSFSKCFREIQKIKEDRNKTIKEVKEEKYKRRAAAAKEAAKAAFEKNWEGIQVFPLEPSPPTKDESLKTAKSNSSTSCDRPPRRMFGIKIFDTSRIQM